MADFDNNGRRFHGVVEPGLFESFYANASHFSGIGLSALVIIAAGAYASIQFPSHDLGNPKMPPASLFHKRLVLGSVGTAALTPLWLTLMISSFGSPNFRYRNVKFIIAGAVAGVSSMVGLALAVFIGCNDVGVCF